MKRNSKGVGLSLLATITVLIVAGIFLLASESEMGKLAILKSGEPVYVDRRVDSAGSTTIRESCYEIPQASEEVARELIRELPDAVERKGTDGFHLVLPRIGGGRVRVSEYPQMSIVVRDGKVSRHGGMDTRQWSHIVIREHRSPSVIEGVWRWIGEKLKV